MAGENSGTDNPLSQGSDPHSVETAADDFTAMLRDEGDNRPARREREPKKPAAQSPEPEGEDDPDERTERQPAKRERAEPSEGQGEPDDRRSDRDPILDGDEPEDNGEGDETDNDEDEPEDDDDSEDEDEPDDEGKFLEAKHTVKVNGKDVEVSGREALNGYMRQADYTQGAERNAREYEEIETYAAESVQHRQTALTRINEAVALVEALQPSKEDMEWLKANDPEKFIKANEHWNGILEKARGLLNGRNELADQGNKQGLARDARYFETQERELVKKLPALREEKKAEAFRSAIMEYGLKNGYTREELAAGATDHRDLITLYKAAQYDRSKNSIREAGKRATDKAPKSSNDGRARVPNKPRGTAQRNADRRLARTGTVQSAADSFAEMIRGESR